MRVRAALLTVMAATIVAGSGAHAQTPQTRAGKPPELEKFVARYNPTSTTTFYIAVANDPDGGKLQYRWTLRSDCGFLTDPRAIGPSNGFQFGPPARRPDGCPPGDQRAAMLTVRIVDPQGCAIVYTQRARDETEHLRPAVRTEPCPPVPGSGGDDPGSGGAVDAPSKGFPFLAVLLVLVGFGGGFLWLRARARTSPARPAPDVPWEQPIFDPGEVEPVRPANPPSRFEPEPAPSLLDVDRSSADPDGFIIPTRRARERIVTDDDEAVPAFVEAEPQPIESLIVAAPPVEDEPLVLREASEGGPVAVSDSAASVLDALLAEELVGPAPCPEGAERSLDNDFVAHDTVLSGVVRAFAHGYEPIEVSPSNPRDIVRLAAHAGSQPIEVEVEIPLRLVTVVSTRREVCRGGRWVLDVRNSTHDGPERTERLRVIASAPEDLERFADQILARRLRTLADARRRLETALASMQDRG